MVCSLVSNRGRPSGERDVNRPSRSCRHLWVDLDTGRSWSEDHENMASRFIGGRGVNTYLLLQHLPRGADPLGPDNVLVFGAGPLVGTAAPGACRLSVDALSPVTGGIGSANCGGAFAPELRYAGYDHLVLTGKAERPVVIVVRDDHLELRPADGLWGLTTWQTERALRDMLGCEYQVLSIGPAGERGVLGACIITDGGRAAAKCGLGAVMGSKNVKAIAVSGSHGVSVAWPQEFLGSLERVDLLLRRSVTAGRVRQYGTYSQPESQNQLGFMPVRYFQDEYWDERKLGNLSPELYKSRYEVRRKACFSCPLHCSHIYAVQEGPYAGTVCEGFEANTQKNFGSRFDVDYAPALIKAHGLCNEMGIDEDFASCVIAWAFECFEHGILNTEDTGGTPLRWGDHMAMIQMVEDVALRRGLGDLLAMGTRRASEIIGRGSDLLAVHIKGQDSMESMRSPKAWALGCAVSPRGGSHTRGANLVEFLAIDEEEAVRVWGTRVCSPRSYEGKAALVLYFECLHAVLDSMGVCFYTSNWVGPDLLGPVEYAALLRAATGMEVQGAALLEMGERIHTLEKLFNIRHAGFGRVDDYPPIRFFSESIRSGPFEGEVLNRSRYDEMLTEYYELHGWDPATGRPTARVLEKLDLSDLVDS